MKPSSLGLEYQTRLSSLISWFWQCTTYNGSHEAEKQPILHCCQLCNVLFKEKNSFLTPRQSVCGLQHDIWLFLSSKAVAQVFFRLIKLMTVNITLKNYTCVQPKQVELTACHNQMQKLISLWTGKGLLETDGSLSFFTAWRSVTLQ